MNEYDSARMADSLDESLHMTQTNQSSKADIIILNNCSISEKAQEKVY